MTPKSPHTIVRASAGSGKTYQLTNRFIAKLIAGEDPSTIFATTFTKAAAGEILHRVLLRLSNAILDENALKDLRDAINTPSLSSNQCTDVLSSLCKNLHKLSIQTMDSYFFRLASSFAPELGLPTKFRMLDEEDLAALQESSVDQTIDACEIRELVEILRSLGGDRIRMMAHDSILRLVQSAYSIYLASNGRAEPWNAVGFAGVKHTQDELDHALQELDQQELPSKKDGNPDKRWLNARNDIRDYLNTSQWEALVEKGLGKLVLNWIIDGELGSYYSKECSEEIAQCLKPIVEHAQFLLTAQHGARSAATYSLMKRYDDAFRNAKMNSGQLSFDDPPRLLNEAAIQGELEHIFYRLDARIRHILLDEFQDTSMPQFRLFEPILDELLSQDEDERSVFIVGDIKQSLYTWRQSEPTLLNELTKRWSTLEEESLSKSWRSSQRILDATNAVFGDLINNPAVQSSSIAQDIARQWDDQYETHHAAKTLPGHVTLSVADSNEEDNALANDEVLWACANQVAEIQSHQPDASVAILVRQTKHIYPLLSMLSQLEIEACEDRGNPLVNAPCVASAISMLEFIEHPGNSAALYHARSTPLGDLLDLDSITNLDAFASSRRRRIEQQGCSSLLIDWYKALISRMDQRGSDRFKQLIELAGQLEDEGKPEISTLIHRANTKKVEEPGRSQVRVITIHRSKGLEFDAVVMPLLGQAWSIRPDSMLAIRDDPMGEISKITPYPTKLLQRVHPRLKEMHDECLAKQINEELCCLYVAMTRAKSALHMIVPADKDGRSGDVTEKLKLTPAHIVRAALASDVVCAPGDILFESGAPDWIASAEHEDQHQRIKEEITLELRSGTTQQTALLTMESPTALKLKPSPLDIDPDASISNQGILIGSCVHELFEQINWIDDPVHDFHSIAVPNQSGIYSESVLSISKQIVEQAFQSDQIHALHDRNTWIKEHPNTQDPTVHHERPFALRMRIENEDRLIQGRFDRLVIARTKQGIQSIQLVDYKTDADAPELADDALIERHGPQLELYRQALCELYRVDPSIVECVLVFTARPGTIKL